MEKFEDMLEMYLNEEEIEYKKKIDEEEMEIEKKTNKYRHEFKNTITIREFVNCYLETEHDCDNLKHVGLKSFKNPYVIGVSNDFAIKNMEYVLKNEILIVTDAYNNPAAYINPIILKQIETMEQLKYTMNILEKIRIHNIANIKKLYEEFDDLNKRMKLIKNNYLKGNEILRKLNKKYILSELKKYTEKSTEINILFEENREEIDQTLNFEYSLIEKIEDIIVDIEYNENITDKVNRQRKVKTRSKRQIVRKGE